MRVRFTGWVAAGLLSSQFAMAEPCVRPADRAAFDMEGLKSELMVTALSCNVQDKYNAFVTHYRGELGTQEKALNAYFTRAYGRGSQKAHDDYITNLANVQSGDGLKAGTLFCARNVPMFEELQALKSNAEVPQYVAGKDITQPVALSSCGGPEPVVRNASSHETHGHATTTRRAVHKS